MRLALKKASIASFICASASVFFAPQAASAFVVSVPGQGTYDIRIQDTAFSGFTAPESQMPWWGNQSIANTFAMALGPELGSVFANSNLGPFFAWDVREGLVEMDAFCIGAPCFNLIGVADTAFSFAIGNPAGTPDINDSYPWAVATRLDSPSGVPGPLPLLGVAAAFGFSRKLRRRINSK